MTEYRQNFIVIGAILLLIVIVFLMSNPRDILSHASYFIDVELNNSSGLEVPVATKSGLGTLEHLSNFPVTIKGWHGYESGDAIGAQEILKSDVLLMRTYHKQTLSQPVHLLLMYGERSLSFHPPARCYRAFGYEIEEEGQDLVYVKDVSWLGRSNNLDPSKLPEWLKKEVEAIPFSELGYWVSVKKLIVFKQENGNITERRVILYFYIRDESLSQKFGMLRCSALIPVSGNYDSSLNVVKEFMSEAIPLLFEPVEPGVIFMMRIASWGIRGYLTIIVFFIIPIFIITYPLIKTRRERETVNKSGAHAG